MVCAEMKVAGRAIKSKRKSARIVLWFIASFFNEVHIRRREDTAQFAKERFSFFHRIEHLKPRMGVYPGPVKTLDGFYDTVSRFFSFLLKRAEQSVPDNECSAKILIDINIVH